MNKTTSPATAMANRMRLQSPLIGHMADQARINPAAPGAGITPAQAPAMMLGTVRAMDADKR